MQNHTNTLTKMNKQNTKNTMSRFAKPLAVLGIGAMSFMASCTNLDETIYDVIPSAGFGNTPEQLAALLGPAYSNLRNASWNFHNMEVTSDVMLVPTRGKDWYDGGNWLNLHRHTWTSQLGPLNDFWGWCFEGGGISGLNSLIKQVNSNATLSATAKTAAVSELRAIRAFYYLILIDMFGNVPILKETDAPTSKPATAQRADVYAFIEKELTESSATLPKEITYSKMNYWVAKTLLAKLYLNAGVYKGAPEWAKAAATADEVIKSGKFSLAPNFFQTFATNNETSPEIVWAFPHDRNQAGGMNIQMRTLHYANQATFKLNGAPWNGFCSLAEFYKSFDDTDTRKAMFLVGNQTAADGTQLFDDNKDPLVFTVEVPKDEYAQTDKGMQGIGARLQKYAIQRSNTSNDQDNDWVALRLADVILMRAEANFRAGNTAAALTDLNAIRARAGVKAFVAADVTADNILAERGREMAWEGWRRSDLIRFGEYTKSGSKFVKDRTERTNLMPIPQPRIDANPGIKQNAGY